MRTTPNTLDLEADNSTRLLLTGASGAARLITFADVPGGPGFAAVAGSDKTYGPFTGFRPEAIDVGGDNDGRLLWNQVDGRIALWYLNPVNDLRTRSDGSVDACEYGPYPYL